MQRLVAAPEAAVIDRGRVVLHGDPAGDNQRRGKDSLQHGIFTVPAVVVLMKERATRQVQSLRTPARSRDKCAATRQAPLRAHL